MEQSEAMLQAIRQLLTYSPYVYNQAAAISGVAGEYFIRFPYTELPKNSLLYMLPTTNSIEFANGQKNRLRIKFAQTDELGNVTYGNDKYYDIVVEQSNGLKQYASTGHIVANRLAIFRIGNTDDGTVTLINSPLYNEISLTSLVVTNAAIFHQKPKVALEEPAGDATVVKYATLVTSDELSSVIDRLEKLEQKFQVGTIDAETALADYPDGTFYVKVEES